MGSMQNIKPPVDLTIAPQARPAVANPAPLGLAGFGLTTVILSCINAGLLPLESTSVVVSLAFAFGGAAQFLAGILEFVNGNTFGTVAFTSYGMFWWWYALMSWTIGAGWIKPPAPVAVATVLLLWGIFTLYMWIATFAANKGVWTVFLLLWLTFGFLAAGDFGWTAGRAIGGWLGIATGVAALYVSFAEVANGAYGREVIPLGRPFVAKRTEAGIRRAA
ncbi:MAG: acetate uptake transporter [Terriglobales bacterium]